MNAHIFRPFSEEDIRLALKQIHRYKALGIDEMLGMFFWRFWEVVGPDVTQCCLQILNSQISPQVLNETLITLIPKTKQPCRISEFRSISLCNVNYKLILKALVNRLKPLLNDIISPNQSAFIPGRCVVDKQCYLGL